jgi:hypothetical protein
MKEFRNYSDKELDELFREAHDATELSSDFQPEFWDEMEMLLPEKKQKRRAGMFWWTSAAILVVAVGYFIRTAEQPNTSSQNKQIALKTNLKNKILTQDKQTNNSKELPTTTQQKQASIGQLVQKRLVNNQLQSPQVDMQVLENVDVPNVEPKQITVDLSDVKNNLTNPSLPIYTDSFMRLKVIEPGMNITQLIASKNYSYSPRCYVQVGAGIGKSYQTDVLNKTNNLRQLAVGAGLIKQVNGMQLTAGIQLRSEFLSNIQWTEPLTTSSYKLGQAKQIYSFDFPLSIGAVLPRNQQLAFTITPGIQSFYVGSSSIITNNEETAREQKVETLQHTKSLTMEMGLCYSYAIRRTLLLGGQVNVDVIRPFNTNYYAGKQSSYPVNGQIFIRKLF